MNIVVMIKGREAIPVRAIPFLTNWETMSPDAIARALARDDFFWTFDGLNAYCEEDENFRLIEATWWENFACRKLKALSDSIKATETTHETGYQEWQEKSLEILPAGTFVWKDEFAPLHAARYGRYGTTYITASGGVMTEDEQQRRTALNFEPFIPDTKIKIKIMEGFEIQELAVKFKPAPLQRTAAQDAAILSAITNQGLKPLEIPKNTPGKPGVKATIRTALTKDSLFVGSTIFDKAWVRLTSRGEIVIKK
jgi:hypothetical protein